MTRRSILFSIRGSLWFVPVLLMVLSVVAALCFVQLDRWLQAANLDIYPDVLPASASGAREILSVIASSSITVAGVIFSITILTLSLAAAQYSPRVLRSFMRDRLNQAVLGVLISLFVYSLLVMRATAGEDGSFVPQLSLWLAVLLVLVALGFLIAFIHNSAVSIHAPEIASRIAAETIAALDSVQRSSHKDKSAQISAVLPNEKELRDISWQPVPAHKSGYVQDVDVSSLFAIACERNITIRVEHAVGDFVVAGRALLQVAGLDKVDARFTRKLQGQFGIDSYRTIEQDPAFGIRELVDIAIKALSPSINDTSTAIHCLDHLGVILHHAARRRAFPQTHRQQDKLRLIMERPESSHLIDLAFNEIRQAARGNVALMLRLFHVARELREDIAESELRKRIREHIRLVGENIEREVPSASDRTILKQAEAKAVSASAQ